MPLGSANMVAKKRRKKKRKRERGKMTGRKSEATWLILT
jgi:hypothetical protein